MSDCKKTVTYSSALTTNSPKYCRPGRRMTRYYYEAIAVTSSSSATFTFKSNSNIDLYGYLYANSFNASNPSWNLLIGNDDSGVNQQFAFQNSLVVRRTYILVVTTYSENVYGPFTIKVSATSATFNFSLIAAPIKTTTTTTTTTMNTTSIKRAPVTTTEGQ